jgi:hypothetical protein
MRAYTHTPIQDVYGFSMVPIAEDIREAQARRACVQLVDGEHLTTNTVEAKVSRAADAMIIGCRTAAQVTASDTCS